MIRNADLFYVYSVTQALCTTASAYEQSRADLQGLQQPEIQGELRDTVRGASTTYT